MARIKLTDLTKSFDDVTAVSGIDLEARDGEFLVLVGPSGCGKSTTLRCIAGLETLTDGSLHIGTTEVTSLPPKDRSVAMVFQDYALYPHMTAAENMRFGLSSSGDYSSDEIESKVETAGEVLGIGELLNRRPGKLSGGEQQRVAIGRAIVREPEVFLLDEPLSNLDAKLRIEMRAELLQIHRELDATTLYVTHDQTEAMTLGDRVAVMNGGQIEQVSPPQTLYDFPQTRFVAEFVGNPAMNVLPVTIDQRGESFYAVHDGFDVKLPVDETLERLAGDNQQLGIRPEDISIVDDDRSDAIQTEVITREPLGESLLLRVAVAGNQFQMKAEPRTALSPGDTTTVAFDTERLHLFDPADGTTVYHAARAEEISRRELTTQQQN